MTFSDILASLMDTNPRPGLHPVPGTVPLTLEAAICPPVIYYLALLFLPPPPPQALDSIGVHLLRNTLALLAGFLFFRLPLAYHVPQSVGLTYQLGLIGLYGGCRVLDAFFISPYFFNHIPRRVKYHHLARVETPAPQGTVTKERPTVANGFQSQADNKKKDDDDDDKSFMERISNGQVRGVITPAADPHTARLSASDMADNVTTTLKNGSMPSASDSYFLLEKTLAGPKPQPVTEIATSEDGWPHSFLDRASWALELELSMRGVGFTWTTADVRHTRKTWLPTIQNRVHSIMVHVVPILGTCFAVIRYMYTHHIHNEDIAWEPQVADSPTQNRNPFDTRLALPQQLLLTAALGAFLMAAFSFAHSLFAIICAPLAPSPLAFFPPLYTTPVWDIASVRGFWSYGWHRLFARLFLVYGVWPGEWLERKLTGKRHDQPADVGKVLGGFISSAFCHSFAVRCVLGGEWGRATGEAWFFAMNGLAVVVEEIVSRIVYRARKKAGKPLTMWYDGYVGRVWWISVLLYSGRNFARGWVNAGLVREMAAM
ncbi:hypothetical protein MBLNU457_6068t1 [Dothideomycetes sp. NU457]